MNTSIWKTNNESNYAGKLNNLLDLLDKYKYGLLASLSVFLIIFLYLMWKSFPRIDVYEAFHDGSYVEVPKEEIRLKADNILLPSDYTQNIKNMARDENDDRERTYDDYSINNIDASVEQELRDLERKMYEEAGGEKTRDEIRSEINERKLEASKEENKPNQSNANRGDKAFAGKVMVDWVLQGRDPHKKNNWFVRNPGYTCGYGAIGLVTVMIKVNQNGNVVSATYDETQSRSANSCMIEQAIKYAKMSRFSFDSKKSQTGRISYTFVTQ